jgi:hypothetical protein
MNALLTIERKLYKELILMLDSKLEAIVDDSNKASDPDSFGYFDSAEHLTGLGFVSLQAFLTAVYGILGVEKKKALSLGPKHTDGNSVAKIVNDAANYWKHNNEWSLEKNSKWRELIENTFESVGFPIDTDYPLCGILTELSVPKSASFMAIFERLEIWQKSVEENI